MHHNILLNRLGLALIRSFYAINTGARYILLSRLGLGITFIQWIPLRSYNDTHFVAVTLFVVTPATPEQSIINIKLELHFDVDDKPKIIMQITKTWQGKLKRLLSCLLDCFELFVSYRFLLNIRDFDSQLQHWR